VGLLIHASFRLAQREPFGVPKVLINAVTVQADRPKRHMSGKATNQDLAANVGQDCLKPRSK
jgi:hypothetical protein